MFALDTQAQTVEVRLDRDHILIGGRINYELLIGLPDSGRSVHFHLPDSIPHFDIIENKPFDTVSENNRNMLHKLVVLTSFDSGSRVIPPFDVEIGSPEKNQIVKTRPLTVDVGYSPSDTTGLKDIKPIMGITVSANRWMYIAAAALLVAIIALVTFLYLRKRKKKPIPLFHSPLSAFDEAMQEIGKLSWSGNQRPEVVKFHDALSFIFRRYYSRQQNLNLLAKTTGDLLLMLKSQQADPAVVTDVADVLRQTDAVKFAKYIPSQDQALEQKQKLKEGIQHLNTSIYHPRK